MKFRRSVGGRGNFQVFLVYIWLAFSPWKKKLLSCAHGGSVNFSKGFNNFNDLISILEVLLPTLIYYLVTVVTFVTRSVPFSEKDRPPSQTRPVFDLLRSHVVRCKSQLTYTIGKTYGPRSFPRHKKNQDKVWLWSTVSHMGWWMLSKCFGKFRQSNRF